MSDFESVVLGIPDQDNFVALARSKQGKLFRKELLTEGVYAHPTVKGKKLVLNEKVFQAAVKNFEDGVCDIVQVPKATKNNEHSEDPDDNLGEVIGLEIGKNSKGKTALFSIIDARKNPEAFGKTYLGASAFLHMNYTNTKTGAKVGPTVLHACVTNRPYITGMDNYEEIIAASHVEDGDAPEFLALTDEPVTEEAPPAPQQTTPPDPEGSTTPQADSPSISKPVPQEEETTMSDTPAKLTFEQIKAALKNDFNVDLDEVQNLALSAVQKDEEVVSLTAEAEEKDEKITELTQTNATLETRLSQVEQTLLTQATKAAEVEVDKLISAGKLKPAAKEQAVALALSNREQFEAMIPDAAVIPLGNEIGVQTTDESVVKLTTQEEKDAEAERLANMAHENRKTPRRRGATA